MNEDEECIQVQSRSMHVHSFNFAKLLLVCAWQKRDKKGRETDRQLLPPLLHRHVRNR